MKIKILNTYKTKLLKLKLLTTKVFKNKKNINYLFFKNVEIKIKKMLCILYNFQLANKKILFVGTELRLNSKVKKLLKNKKHNFLPKSVWIHGIITNTKSLFKHLVKQYTIFNNKTFKYLFNLKNEANLIVIFNEKFNQASFNEILLKRIPIISFNVYNNLSNSNLSIYKITNNFNFVNAPIQNNFFFIFFNSLLKKVGLLKKKQI